MARIYYKNTDGDYIRDDDGAYMTGEPEDCCCEEPCDCEAEGAAPTAALSYEQTDDDPCTLDLFDESTAGTCGDIVAWRWLKNGVEVSTAQNPTGITYADGDDFTLEVTDSEGCTDSAVMEVECADVCCGCVLPEHPVLTLSGCVNITPVGAQCMCLGFLPLINRPADSGFGTCIREFRQTNADGNAQGVDCSPWGGSSTWEYDYIATLSITCEGGVRTIRLELWHELLLFGSEEVFELTEPDDTPCDGGWDLPQINAEACEDCVAHISW